MQVLYEKSFYHDIKKLRDPNLKKSLRSVIEIIKNSQSPASIPKLKKLRGTKNYYRIKIKNYRLGLKIDGDTVILIRFLSRKDIYKSFPP
ncbi:type II toxin-antitoxin system RelE family toxin [Thermodesulfatator atlanticus]